MVLSSNKIINRKMNMNMFSISEITNKRSESCFLFLNNNIIWSQYGLIFQFSILSHERVILFPFLFFLFFYPSSPIHAVERYDINFMQRENKNGKIHICHFLSFSIHRMMLRWNLFLIADGLCKSSQGYRVDMSMHNPFKVRS